MQKTGRFSWCVDRGKEFRTADHDIAQRRRNLHGNHILRQSFSQSNPGIEALCDDVDQLSLGNNLKLHRRIARHELGEQGMQRAAAPADVLMRKAPAGVSPLLTAASIAPRIANSAGAFAAMKA